MGKKKIRDELHSFCAVYTKDTIKQKLPALNDGECDKYEEGLRHKKQKNKSNKIAINVADTL